MGKTSTDVNSQQDTNLDGEKPKGWHSRRHETRTEQDAARELHETKAHLREVGADRREYDRSQRTDAEQLKLLKGRPGKSARETARLQKRLKAAA